MEVVSGEGGVENSTRSRAGSVISDGSAASPRSSSGNNGSRRRSSLHHHHYDVGQPLAGTPASPKDPSVFAAAAPGGAEADKIGGVQNQADKNRQNGGGQMRAAAFLLEQLRAELGDSRNEHEAMKREISQLKENAEIKANDASREEMEVNVAQQSRKAALEEAKEAGRAQEASIREELAKLTESRDCLAQELRETQDEAEAHQQESKRRASEKDQALKEERHSWDAEKAHFREELYAAHQSVTDFAKQGRDAQAADAKAQAKALEAERERWEKQQEKLRTELRDAQESKDEMFEEAMDATRMAAEDADQKAKAFLGDKLQWFEEQAALKSELSKAEESRDAVIEESIDAQTEAAVDAREKEEVFEKEKQRFLEDQEVLKKDLETVKRSETALRTEIHDLQNQVSQAQVQPLEEEQTRWHTEEDELRSFQRLEEKLRTEIQEARDGSGIQAAPPDEQAQWQVKEAELQQQLQVATASISDLASEAQEEMLTAQDEAQALMALKEHAEMTEADLTRELTKAYESMLIFEEETKTCARQLQTQAVEHKSERAHLIAEQAKAHEKERSRWLAEEAQIQTQLSMAHESKAAFAEEAASQAQTLSRMRSELAVEKASKRNSLVPPIRGFSLAKPSPASPSPETFWVGDDSNEKIDSARSSCSSELRMEPTPRTAAKTVPGEEEVGQSDWQSLDMVGELYAGEDVGRIGVGFRNLPPVPLVVRRVTKGTWAEKQGILVGDEFMSVNHRRSREFRPSEFLQEMTKRPLTIRLRRTVQKEGVEGMAVSIRVAGLPSAASDEELSSVDDQSSSEEEADEGLAEDAWRSPDEAAKDAQLLAEEVAKNNASTLWRRAGKKITGRIKQERVVAALREKQSSPNKSKKRLSNVHLQEMQEEEDRLREVFKEKATNGTLGGVLSLDVWNEKQIPGLQDAVTSSSSTLVPNGSSSTQSSPAEGSGEKR
mmetsp:Transcript_51103/g.91775  ORF Transcript_51103/g.91775 Transcript_51103/m.91775 type:complete len:953 (+) Transcript_51103:90-2948(+)